MAAHCKTCDIVIPPERCVALIEANVPLEEWTCVEHGFKGKVYGYMVESSGGSGDIRNVGRKGGYVIQTLRSDDPNFKEKFRLAERYKRRAR